MNESSLFLRNFTCIDHAYIDNYGYIFGGSFHQEVIVTGGIEEHEQVVVDFSKVKKLLKQYIDDNETGYDHKLWIIRDFSVCEVSDEGDNWGIKTPSFQLSVPKNAVRFIDNVNNKTFFSHYSMMVENDMTEYLHSKLSEEVPHFIGVDVKLTETAFSPNEKSFTYFHGLKNSSSWGCQNIAHGHTSFIEAYDRDNERIFEVEDLISSFLNNAMIVFDDNLDLNEDKISYTTPRGNFSLKWEEEFVKVIIMNSETTVENILDHVCQKFDYFLHYHGVSKVFISEGLQKGAVKFLNKY